VSIEARFRFGHGDFCLDVALELPGRGVTSVFGPSGCGKTSLLRAIAGLDRHADAYLRVGDVCWQDGQRFVPTHRRRLGYVFQEPSLFDHLDIRGNIAYGMKRSPPGERRVRFEEAIQLLDLSRFLDRRPADLSGGERQRVSIARALASSPRLLLMDEPLAAVDVTRKQEILPYIESLHRELDIPVIHVSHLPEEVARIADHLLLMENGRVTASGAAPDLFARLDLPMARADDAASVVDARVAGHEEAFALTRLAFSGGEFLVSRLDLPPGETVRLRIAARDVSLTLERHTGTSILNIVPARVEALHELEKGLFAVRLAVGDTPILARITRKSVVELGLAPGLPVYAQVKSIALLQ
jgi:molybdate transport system ATP-binding protein